MKENNLSEVLYDAEIDFSLILFILWKRRKFLIFGMLAAILLSIGTCLLLPRVYRSEGFYQLGNPTKNVADTERSAIKKTATITKKTGPIGVPVPLYKSSSSQFFNPNRFLYIASHDKSFKKEELTEIAVNFRKAEDISKWIKPVYAFSKEDAREFSQLPQDESNSVIGLNLAYEGDSPEKASSYVLFFGKYIRDCLLYVTLCNYVMDGYSNSISEMNKIENEIIEMKYQLLQEENKIKDIRAILTNYPNSAKIENRQLVSVQEGGERFLAPVTQLVGIESGMAGLRQTIAGLERDREKLTARSDYFTRCYSELKKTGEQGEFLFLLLKSIKDEIFTNKDITKDEVKEVFNNLSIDLQTFDLNFFSNSRFISGPTFSTAPIKPRKSLIAIVSCLVSFFLLVIWVFVSHWWQGNKKTITLGPSL
jgi:hypothetical protein